MLTEEQLKARQGKLTASAVGALMSGDRDKIMNLWRELTGDPEYVRNDLRNVWPVRLGETTEQLNLDWFEHKNDCKVIRRGEVVVHPTCAWAAATLDGWVPIGNGFPIECKHVGGREPFDRIIGRYMPQCHWQMICTNAATCVLSVIEGANEPRIAIIHQNDDYIDALWERAKGFMDCVFNLRPPFVEESVAPPVRAIRSVDMSGRNEWAVYAGTWLECVDASKRASNAEKALKGLMPIDAVKAYGHGIEINRDRAGRLSLMRAA